MWEEVLEKVATSGIFAVLFVSLLCYLLQDSRKREAKYQKIIETLTDRLEVVEDIKESVDRLSQKPKKQRKPTPVITQQVLEEEVV